MARSIHFCLGVSKNALPLFTQDNILIFAVPLNSCKKAKF